MKEKAENIFSKMMSALLVFLALIVISLFFKTITNGDVSLFGLHIYYVATESMYPTIKPNSIMVVGKVNTDDLEVGDIISFTSEDPSIYGMVNTHRIYDITVDENGEKAFVTKGDNNPREDDYPVSPDKVIGKVLVYTPPMKLVADLFSYAATPVGFFVVILMPLMLVAAYLMGSMLRTMRQELASESVRMTDPAAADPLEKDADFSQYASRRILETYFNKPLEEVTKEDIEKALQEVAQKNNTDSNDINEGCEHVTE